MSEQERQERIRQNAANVMHQILGVGRQGAFSGASPSSRKRAFADDTARVEMMICKLPTSQYEPVNAMNTKALVGMAKKRKLVDEKDLSAMDKEDLRKRVVEAEDTTCAVCLDGFQVTDFVKTWPCGHVFHLNCSYQVALFKTVGEMRKDSIRCPTCRHPVA